MLQAAVLYSYYQSLSYFRCEISTQVRFIKIAKMSDCKGNKEVARQLLLDLKCSVCKDVPGFFGVRRNRYVCSKGRHLVCEDCKSGDCSCGSKAFSDGPVEFVENILKKSQWHYCCYFKHGCQDIVGVQDLEDHQKGCEWFQNRKF